MRWIHNTVTLCCNQYVGGMVIKLHPFPPTRGRSRLMFLVSRRDDEVSYYPTSRSFKITMNILRNSSDSTTVFLRLVTQLCKLFSFFFSALTWRQVHYTPSHAVCPWGQLQWSRERREGAIVCLDPTSICMSTCEVLTVGFILFLVQKLRHWQVRRQ